MNRTEHLLTCLAEECAEVAQRVSKALRFGLDEVQSGQNFSNAERIVAELEDLAAVANILASEGAVRSVRLTASIVDRKREKIERFMAISREQGVLA
jgi:NTP pyrophosphatase (non-canonical NTP hydrolase)